MRRPSLTFLLCCSLASGLTHAATLTARLTDPQGQPLEDAVLSLQGPPGGAASPTSARMDQHDKMFVPHVLAIHTGTSVQFPNTDDIRHQVYSFSQPKRFELKLYQGTPTAPLVFDKPGVVVLGCNIHDWMLGYVYVTQAPWFAVSDKDGQVKFDNLPPGQYHAKLWHPRAPDLLEQDGGTLDLAAAPVSKSFKIDLDPQAKDSITPPAPSAFGAAFEKAAHDHAD